LPLQRLAARGRSDLGLELEGGLAGRNRKTEKQKRRKSAALHTETSLFCQIGSTVWRKTPIDTAEIYPATDW
jgi:hypothetical protein